LKNNILIRSALGINSSAPIQIYLPMESSVAVPKLSTDIKPIKIVGNMNLLKAIHTYYHWFTKQGASMVMLITCIQVSTTLYLSLVQATLTFSRLPYFFHANASAILETSQNNLFLHPFIPFEAPMHLIWHFQITYD